MQVYIEDAIFDTTIINFVILYLSLFSLKQKINFLKVFLSAILGSAISLFLTFFNLSLVITIILKLLCGLLMIALCIKIFDYKTFFLTFLVFTSFTFLIGGFCFFVIYLLGGQIYSISKMTYNLPVSLGVITVLIFVYVFFLIKVINIFYKKQKLNNFYYDLNLTTNNKTKKIKAYLDSGNLLQDPNTGQPILVLGLKSFLNIYKDKVTIIDFLNQKLHLKISGKYILFNSVGGQNKMFVFKPNSVEVINNKKDKTEISVLIGVGNNNFSQDNFDALLSPLSI